MLFYMRAVLVRCPTPDAQNDSRLICKFKIISCNYVMETFIDNLKQTSANEINNYAKFFGITTGIHVTCIYGAQE